MPTNNFAIFLDDIRLHGFVGHFSEGHLLPHTHSVQLFTHLQFYIGYNGQKVITPWVPGLLKSQTSEAEGLTNARAFVAATPATSFQS